MIDVVVIGGGPGGAVCATELARRGRRVVVLEKARFPRFHLGESLLPGSMPVLEAIGVLDEARARFMIKTGARFHSPDGATARYGFDDAYGAKGGGGWALQVPRDELDEMLLRRAAAVGAEVREGCEATRVVFEGDRAIGVEARDEAGGTVALPAKVVVDASGRDAVIGRGKRATERIAGLDKTALFTQFRGAWRDEGAREGDIQIVLFGGGWIWNIPFADGRTSVGAVVASEWLRAAGSREPAALFDRAIAEAPAEARILAGATRLFEPRAAADFSFRARDLAGDGWLAVGDAGGFIDPLFSTGAHLAIHGGFSAARAIDEALAREDVSRPRFSAWEAESRRGAGTFLGAVLAFYGGQLSSYLFAEEQHPFFRRSITSLLAGDVFHEDSRWLRELRARFPAPA